MSFKRSFDGRYDGILYKEGALYGFRSSVAFMTKFQIFELVWCFFLFVSGYCLGHAHGYSAAFKIAERIVKEILEKQGLS